MGRVEGRLVGKGLAKTKLGLRVRWRRKTSEKQLGFNKANPLIFWSLFVLIVFSLWLLKIFRITDRYVLVHPENLVEAWNLTQRGYSVVVVPHHSGELDTILFLALIYLNKDKLPGVDALKLIRGLIFFIGLRFLEEHPIWRILVQSVNRIKVFPSTMINEETRERADIVNANALQAYRKLRTQGNFFVNFLQGTRSKKGPMLKAPRGARALIRGAYILPVAMVGFHELLPVGSSKVNLQHPLKITFGKPISQERFETEVKKLANKWGVRSADLEVHWVMKRVAAIFKREGDSSYLGYYRRTWAEIIEDEGLLPEAA